MYYLLSAVKCFPRGLHGAAAVPAPLDARLPRREAAVEAMMIALNLNILSIISMIVMISIFIINL